MFALSFILIQAGKYFFADDEKLQVNNDTNYLYWNCDELSANGMCSATDTVYRSVWSGLNIGINGELIAVLIILEEEKMEDLLEHVEMRIQLKAYRMRL